MGPTVDIERSELESVQYQKMAATLDGSGIPSLARTIMTLPCFNNTSTLNNRLSGLNVVQPGRREDRQGCHRSENRDQRDRKDTDGRSGNHLRKPSHQAEGDDRAALDNATEHVNVFANGKPPKSR